MTIKEMKKALNYFEKHGKISYSYHNSNNMYKTSNPVWDFRKYSYYPVVEEKEPLYEWWGIRNNDLSVNPLWMTEDDAEEYYSDATDYGKTGRYFNTNNRIVKQIID